MKKLILSTVILTSLLASGVTYAKVIKPKLEILAADNVATIYVGGGDIKVYEVKNASSTCYISFMKYTGGTLNGVSQEISCVK